MRVTQPMVQKIDQYSGDQQSLRIALLTIETMCGLLRAGQPRKAEKLATAVCSDPDKANTALAVACGSLCSAEIVFEQFHDLLVAMRKADTQAFDEIMKELDIPVDDLIVED